MSRDGQEIENSVGRRVCSMIDKHIDEPDSFPEMPPFATTWSPQSPEGDGKRTKIQHTLHPLHPPHPLEDGFDKQVEFFLAMQYEDYVEWWKRFGASSPGPAPPPWFAAALEKDFRSDSCEVV